MKRGLLLVALMVLPHSQFDSGDHVHPNDAGNRAMANAVDLEKLTR